MMFLESLKALAGRTVTMNGAATLRSTDSECLDLFAAIGALRGAPEEEITARFVRAYAENADIAMKILFYARDIREGLGERRVFRVIVQWLADHHRESLVKNLGLVAEYGRFDDLLCLLGTPAEKEALAVLKEQFDKDMAALETGGEVSLLGKWLPSVNASSERTKAMGRTVARAFGMREADYRKSAVRLRAAIRILENSLRERDYTFDYAKQPSRAMFKYRRAFLRNDGERYGAFLDQVSAGKAVLHTAALMPCDIVARAVLGGMSEEERKVLDVTWNSLEDFTNGENALCVIDGSGSMYSGILGVVGMKPAAVAMSLGIYFAERNTGTFRNHFITFSRTPQLVEIKGEDIVSKVQYCRTFNEIANTDLQAVFSLILEAACMERVPRSEMPSTLYIISDMEFDRCAENASLTNFEAAKLQFARAGYKLPRVVFWNVNSMNRQQPVRMNEQGAALVSGYTARIFSQVMSGELDPYTNMMGVIGSERYAQISA